MIWVCPDCKTPLSEEDGRLACGAGHASYARIDGIPVFAGRAAAGAAEAVPVSAEIAGLASARSVEEAARDVCARQGCRRVGESLERRCIFSIPGDGVVLELGVGFGDDTLELASRCERVIGIAPNVESARIVRARLLERDVTNVELAVMEDVGHLPFADGSIAAILLEDDAAPGFGLGPHRLAAAAAEWRRVLRDGGSLVLGLSNPLDRRLGLRRLRGSLRARDRTDSLNRFVKKAGSGFRPGAIGLRRATRALERAGFASLRVYAPLPDENDPQLAIPVTEPRVVKYFLGNMVRRNSWKVRVAVAMAGRFVDLRLFPYLVPYWYVECRAREG